MKICFNKAVLKTILAVTLAATSAFSSAENYSTNGLTISKIRNVGDYSGTTFDNVIELWFTTSINPFPSGSPCSTTFRVIVDAKHKHLVAAAYMALATGRKVDIVVDDTLPVRWGVCEVAYLDI